MLTIRGWFFVGLIGLVVLCGGAGVVGTVLSGHQAAAADTSWVTPTAGGVADPETPAATWTASPAPPGQPSPLAPPTKPPVVRKTHPAPHPTTTKAKPKPSPTTDSTVHGVHAGAFCKQHGRLGVTDDGTLMRCTTTTADSRYRWRAA